jgi:CHAD domain-containing protein
MTDDGEQVGDLVKAYLAEQCSVIIDSEAQLRAGENVVHTTRDAVRRLRSTLRVYAELFDVPQAGRLEEELVWWAALLGEVRDLDILRTRMDALIDELPPEVVLGPVRSTVDTEISVRRKAAADAVVETLDSERYRHLVGLVHEWRSYPPLTEAAAAPAAAVKGYAKRAGKKVDKRLTRAVAAGKANEPAEELFHSARKAGKRHRYAVEAAQPLWGAKADKIIDHRKKLQDLLGDHQDRTVSAAFLRDLGTRLGVREGQNGFTYGLLYGRESAPDPDLFKKLKSYR